MPAGFQCTTCGEFHEGYPLCYGPPAPQLWFNIPEAEREQRCLLSPEVCMVDDDHYFVLGCVEIPIIDSDDMFVWLAWVSLSKENFVRTHELWEEQGRENEPPYFAWFSSALPYETTTLHLKAKLHTRPVGERPCIELQECDHPLYLQQKQGISWAEVQSLAMRLMHGHA
ncbi:DUF2199 domain-containing protein [Undibacterium sp. TS12]|uniref:DUF2199 domain-containing protein n=1 Tax=Undibacterium sp. TS12 TaxID=2908202 RepID=UPI001F4CD8CD|nr:DUF2199 domain-containing protein [Undibacterium sp. TS12]MCH8620516.1 DUF2199 domain-containing protein [Undibacterium sp. TS12]